MVFCDRCKMNVYPTRLKFNIVAFGICAAIIFVPAIIITLSLPFSSIFIFLYFMWGFMFINPYLIYYGFARKKYCPRCYGMCFEKNLVYKPFGPKEPEPFNKL